MIRFAISAFAFLSIAAPAYAQTPPSCGDKFTALTHDDFKTLANEAAENFYPRSNAPDAPKVSGWRVEEIAPSDGRSAMVAVTLLVDHPDVPDEIGIYVIIEDGRIVKEGTRAFVPPREWATVGRVFEPEDEASFADRARQAAIAHVLADVPGATEVRARIDASTASFPEREHQMTLVHVDLRTPVGDLAVRDVFVDPSIDMIRTHDFLSVGPNLAKALNPTHPDVDEWIRNSASHYVVRNHPGVVKPIAAAPELTETDYGVAARVRVFFPDPKNPHADWDSDEVEVRLYNAPFEIGAPGR